MVGINLLTSLETIKVIDQIQQEKLRMILDRNLKYNINTVIMMVIFGNIAWR